MKIIRIGAAFALLVLAWLFGIIAFVFRVLRDVFADAGEFCNDLSRIVTPKNSP